jgi:hypothetical protein
MDLNLKDKKILVTGVGKGIFFSRTNLICNSNLLHLIHGMNSDFSVFLFEKWKADQAGNTLLLNKESQINAINETEQEIISYF